MAGTRYSAEFISMAKKIGAEAKDVAAVWDDYVFRVKLDPSLPGSLKKEGEWAKQAGIAGADSKQPDYNVLVQRDLLPGEKQ